MIGDELQVAIYDALTAANICDGRVYDQVPEQPVFPYITIGDEQVIDDSNSCGDGWIINPDIHIWSRPDTGSKREVKTLRKAAVAALSVEPVLPGFIVLSVSHESARTTRRPDGLTEHEIITMRYLIQPA